MQTWQKRQTVALHRTFFETLPELPEVEPENADVAWLIYDLDFVERQNRFELVPYETIYTQFRPALQQITTPEAGPIDEFVDELQTKLDAKLENDYPPDAPTLTDILNQ